jgi:hypothetical protein
MVEQRSMLPDNAAVGDMKIVKDDGKCYVYHREMALPWRSPTSASTSNGIWIEAGSASDLVEFPKKKMDKRNDRRAAVEAQKAKNG